MWEEIKGFFDEKSTLSITRVAFAWLILNATFMAWFILKFGTKNAPEAGGIFVAVSSVATGLKLYQKHQEKT